MPAAEEALAPSLLLAMPQMLDPNFERSVVLLCEHSSDGTMGLVDGRSKPGDYVELRAESRVLAVVSNCPQTHNPCNGFNPTPIRVMVRGD